MHNLVKEHIHDANQKVWIVPRRIKLYLIVYLYLQRERDRERARQRDRETGREVLKGNLLELWGLYDHTICENIIIYKC